MPHLYEKCGPGIVPALPMYKAAAMELVEAIPDSGLQSWVQKGMAKKLEFTVDGVDVADVREAFAEVLDASRCTEPVVETGNKYGVSKDFHKMNAELVMRQLKNTDMYKALKAEDQQKAEDMFNVVFLNDDLRNRNPLHPAIVDSCVIGNLLNFPKHIFGMPFGSYATDGNESLSLVLYSYREERSINDPVVLYVGSHQDDAALADIELCAERLGMMFIVVPANELDMYQKRERVAVALTSFESPLLGTVASWCEANRISLHLHIRDREWRNIFINSKEPVHFELPAGVRSISIEEGLLNSGYSLYRDSRLRDLHLDVGLAWQTVYTSPNEGGSGQSGPLLMDFCFILLGWKALSWMCAKGLGFRTIPDRTLHRLQPTFVQKDRISMAETSKQRTLEAILSWAQMTTDAQSDKSREELEAELVYFQREFLGGKTRDLETLCTGGGTRSINLAFESVLKRAKAHSSNPVKVITGNPHLAVERAERRFGFDLVRVDVDGTICLQRLKQELLDPTVVAVYTQTLSYTDGISDPMPEIVQLIEEQNQKRSQDKSGLLITLINDSCLAFAVLVMNDGSEGSRNMRALDLTEGCITPTIATLDAHKHLGTDKGVSTVVGTSGTLSNLRGHVKVGAQPSREELVRAIANMWLVGKDGYYQQYQDLSASVEKVVSAVETAGMSLVHKRNRIKGSTVIAVEDPSGACSKMLKKRGHTVGHLFGLCRHDPGRCQTGWQLSFTPYALRHVRDGKPALDVFISDVLDIGQKIQSSSKLSVSKKLFRENTLLAYLISGNIDPFVFQLLHAPGYGRALTQKIVRRYFTANLDSGVIRSLKRPALPTFLQAGKRVVAVILALLGFLSVRRRLTRSVSKF